MKIVCLCGGLGERMAPLSLKCPKSLVPVKFGDEKIPCLARNIMISLNGLSHRYDVNEIVVVSSPEYFKLKDYHRVKSFVSSHVPFDVKFIEVENTKSHLFNNWYSALKVLEEVGTSDSLYMMEGDIRLRLSFASLLHSIERGKSYYFCTYRKNEWTFFSNQHGHDFIKNSNGLAMAGVSIVDQSIVGQLKWRLKDSEPQEFWDESFVSVCRKTLNLINANGLIDEFDTIDDLLDRKLMTSYGIAETISDDGSVKSFDSMTNTNFLIKYNGKDSVLRIPGHGTDQFISRDKEAFVLPRLEKGITPPCQIFNQGVKITEYIPDSRTSTPEDSEEVLKLIARVHSTKVNYKDFSLLITDLVSEVSQYESLYTATSLDDYPEYHEVLNVYRKLIIEHQHEDLVLCHRDFDPRNVILSSSGNYLLDFEYTGLLNRYWDLGAHIAEIRVFFSRDLIEEQDNTYLSAIKKYTEMTGFEVDLDKVKLWSGIVDFVWSCWSIAKISLGENYKDYLNERWNTACKILEDLGMTGH